jgi:hypothetical protein
MMEELLQKLLDADVLSEDTKKELEKTFQEKIDKAVEDTKEQTAADVRAELTEQWVKERDALIEALDTKVGEFLKDEMEELKEDISRFRDLEAEHAEKLVEEKAQMRDEVKEDLAELVEKIDAFLEIRLSAELEELREDIEEQKKNDFGRRIFEAFVGEYSQNYADDESLEGTLRETEERLSDTENTLQETERELSELKRTVRMEEVLSPLTGRQRDVMEAILRNVSTDQLVEGYKTFIGRVVRETEETVEEQASEKEGKVLAEGESKEGSEKKLTEQDGVIVTGDDTQALAEQKKAAEDNKQHLSEGARARLKKLAGL